MTDLNSQQLSQNYTLPPIAQGNTYTFQRYDYTSEPMDDNGPFPACDDMIVSYACADGFKSFRSGGNNGSYYITALYHHLTKKIETKTLVDLKTEIKKFTWHFNRNPENLQVTLFYSTLCKRVKVPLP